MKRTVMTVVLAVVLLAGAVCGAFFLHRAAQLRTAGEDAVAAAQQELEDVYKRQVLTRRPFTPCIRATTPVRSGCARGTDSGTSSSRSRWGIPTRCISRLSLIHI